MNKVLAIFCSDIHLSETAPPARSAEPDWMLAQFRMLEQVDRLHREYKCPIVCAGDVFHRHNPSPALINWAISHLPPMLAVPGQHDLPHHRYEDVQRSAYWTLVMAGVIEDLQMPAHFPGLTFYGFPWEQQPPVEMPTSGGLHVAVSHRFVWSQSKGYEGAPVDRLVGLTAMLYEDFDVAVFGDNHQGFCPTSNPNIFNCGCLIRRKANERDYKPRVGLLRFDGSVDTYFLDLSGDVWADQPDKEPGLEEVTEELREFIADLKDANVGIVDFEEAVKRWLLVHDCSDSVRKILLEVTECHD